MKSDREFLDGIYQKAANYSKQQEIRKRPPRLFLGLAACLLLCVLSFGLIYAGRLMKLPDQDGEPEGQGILSVRNLPEVTKERVAPEPYGIDSAVPAAQNTEDGIGQQISGKISAKTLPALIAEGRILTLSGEAGENTAEFSVEDCFYGTGKEGILILDLRAFSNNGEDMIFAAGEHVLLVLSEAADGWFLLTDGENSKYRYLSGEGKTALYEGADGFTATAEDITEMWTSNSSEEENHGIQ